MVWMFLTTHVTVCVYHAELKSYLLTYLPGGETFWGDTSRPSRGELAKGRNVHKSQSLQWSAAGGGGW